MECPICGAELTCIEYYGRILPHQDGNILGNIFTCPNGAEQDGGCASENHHVAGSFYTDEQGDLQEGYPC